MMFPKMASTMKNGLSPPWQVLDLVAHYLDPKALAAACCVCKSWSGSMSADHLWQPICSAAYPSISNIRALASNDGAACEAAISFQKLYSLGRAADLRRLQKPENPRLSLHDLVFAVDIQNSRGCLATVLIPGADLHPDDAGIFRFDIGVDDAGNPVAIEELDSIRITWNVVLQGFRGVFTMMECRGKGSFVLGLEGWFSKELPAAGCCSGGGGLVADLRLGLRESAGGRVVVEKVGVGVLSIVSWRYVGVDDALRYLQHFLLPSN